MDGMGANSLGSVQKDFELNSKMNRDSVQFFFCVFLRMGDGIVVRSHSGPPGV